MSQNIKNIVFGSSSLIGKELINKINLKESIFTSRSKPLTNKSIIWKKIDLNTNDLKKLPNEVDKIFFFSSPYYLKKNLKKKIFLKELLWVKKVIKNIKCRKIIYISSSSVYSKNHVIGSTKILIEKILLSSNIKIVQIWRPFNLISEKKKNISDHFHNLMLKKSVNQIEFKGHGGEKVGYSTTNKFIDALYKKSNLNKNFINNYKNKNMIRLDQIVKIFNTIREKKKLKTINYKFKNLDSGKKVINKSLSKAKNVYSKEKSKDILKIYYKNMIIK